MAVVFSAKELEVMKVAWSCLKSGPPDVDITKLTEKANFNTTKTASNVWAVIKKKLNSLNPTEGEELPGKITVPLLVIFTVKHQEC